MRYVARAAALVLALAVTSVTSVTPGQAVSPGTSPAVTTGAPAAPPGALDNACGFTSITDPTMRSRQLGELEGGPIVQNGTLTCTIKVNAGTHSAVAADGVSASAQGIGGVTYLHPRVVTYRAAETDVIWLCSEFTDAGGTTYYLDGVDQTWGTDSAAACSLAITG